MWLQLQKFVIRILVAKANGMSQCSWNNAKKKLTQKIDVCSKLGNQLKRWKSGGCFKGKRGGL